MQYCDKKIATRIKRERELLALSQDSLGALIPANRNTIAAWEKEKSVPSLDAMLRMCELFDCELGYLLGEYDCKTREATNIQEVTGLDEEAINRLRSLKRRSMVEGRLGSSFTKQILDAINLLVKNEGVESVTVEVLNNPDDSEDSEDPILAFKDASYGSRFFECIASYLWHEYVGSDGEKTVRVHIANSSLVHDYPLDLLSQISMLGVQEELSTIKKRAVLDNA